MVIKALQRKTGKIVFVSVLFASLVSSAAELGFYATVDRNSISINDPITFRLTMQGDATGHTGEPSFSAPDFDIMSESSSTSFESRYDSSQGGFVTVHRQQQIKIMRPKKTGNLRISNIRLNVGGKVLTSPDILVQVSTQSAPNNPSAGGPSMGAQSNTARQKANPAFIRAEVDKKTAFKGEQVIISYYLYHLVKVFNAVVTKFPMSNGFLREDLDLPVVGQRMDSEQVMVNGIPYERTLLARYAAYPLQTGSLNIDSLGLKFNYYVNPRQSFFDDDEDPFFGFFQQMAPRVASAQSDPTTIEVQDLPTAGRPGGFTGGVGDYNVVSAVNKYEVRANEAVTLTVKIEGRGNLSSVEDPKTQWPSGVELYDSKGRINSKSGIGEKIFEYLLIPRTTGNVQLPSLEFSFFDPQKKEYYQRKTEPLTIHVLEAAPGTQVAVKKAENTSEASSAQLGQPSGKQEDLRYLKSPEEPKSAVYWQPMWRLLYWGTGLALGFLFFSIGSDLLKKYRIVRTSRQEETSDSDPKRWQELLEMAKLVQAGAPWKDVVNAYDSLAHLLMGALEQKYSVGAKAVPLEELKELVQEKGMVQETWDRIVRLLEFSDMVRFASSAGAVPESNARRDFGKWVEEAQSIIRTL